MKNQFGNLMEIIAVKQEMGFDKYFDKSRDRIEAFFNKIADTDYGRNIISSGLINDNVLYKKWKEVPLLTPDKYKDPLDFVRSNEEHSKEDMVILYSGGTTGRPKETYWTKEDIKVELPSDVINRIEKFNFVFYFLIIVRHYKFH